LPHATDPVKLSASLTAERKSRLNMSEHRKISSMLTRNDRPSFEVNALRFRCQAET
jgi:hypothetical protein